MKFKARVNPHTKDEVVHFEVDDADSEMVSKRKWRVDSKGYIVAGINEYLARMIMGATNPIVFVDHKDGNILNNRRSNLRVASNSQNQANRKRQSSNTSGYRGVTWHKSGRKWQAQIKVNNKNIYLGLFGASDDAYEKYKEAANAYFGEFAEHNTRSQA